MGIAVYETHYKELHLQISKDGVFIENLKVGRRGGKG